jgi:hypothetical protein
VPKTFEKTAAFGEAANLTARPALRQQRFAV